MIAQSQSRDYSDILKILIPIICQGICLGIVDAWETAELTSIIGRPPTILERLYYRGECWRREYKRWCEDSRNALHKIYKAVWNNPSEG
jgi:hypothetical protein